MGIRFTTITPTIDTNAYGNGDVVGGLLTFPLAFPTTLSGILEGVTVRDKQAANIQLDLVLFSDQPTASTTTDQGAPSIHANDVNKIVGVINIATADYTTINGKSVATKRDLGLPINSAGRNLYALLISRGTPTYTAASNLSLTIAVKF